MENRDNTNRTPMPHDDDMDENPPPRPEEQQQQEMEDFRTASEDFAKDLLEQHGLNISGATFGESSGTGRGRHQEAGNRVTGNNQEVSFKIIEPSGLQTVQLTTFRTYQKIETMEKDIGTVLGMMNCQRLVEERTDEEANWMRETSKSVVDGYGKLTDTMDKMATAMEKLATRQNEIKEDVKTLAEKTEAIATNAQNLVDNQDGMKLEESLRARRREGIATTVNLIGTAVSSIKTTTDEARSEQGNRDEEMAKRLREFFEAQAATNRMVCIGSRHSNQCLRMLRNMTQPEPYDSDHSSTTSDKKRRREAEQSRDNKQRIEQWDTDSPQASQLDKPHKCDHCGVTFTRRSSVLRHIEQHCQNPRSRQPNSGRADTPLEPPGEEASSNLRTIPIQERLKEAIARNHALQEEHRKREQAPDSTEQSSSANREVQKAGETKPDALAVAASENSLQGEAEASPKSWRLYEKVYEAGVQTHRCKHCTYTSPRISNVRTHEKRMHNKAGKKPKGRQSCITNDTSTTAIGSAPGEVEMTGAKADKKRISVNQRAPAPDLQEEVVELDEEPSGPEDEGVEDDGLLSDEEEDVN